MKPGLNFILSTAMLILSFPSLAADDPLNTSLPIPDTLANQEMRIIEINLAPGQSSSPHRHNAHVYVYILQGEVEMQVRGGPLMKLKAGDTFYESPADIHQVSRNPSTSLPAKFLVHMLKTVGEASSVLVE